MVGDIARLYKNDRKTHDANAAEWVKKYAMWAGEMNFMDSFEMLLKSYLSDWCRLIWISIKLKVNSGW